MLLNRIFTSNDYLWIYNLSDSVRTITLGPKKIHFISDYTIMKKLIKLESAEHNDKTTRYQDYTYNYSLLRGNPVSSNILNKKSYLEFQRQFFIKESQNIDVNSVNLPISNSVVNIVLSIISQIYLKILLNVDPNITYSHQEEFIDLLGLLEKSTGKHNITLKEFLYHDYIEDDSMEIKYLKSFKRLMMKLRSLNKFEESNDKIVICKDIMKLIGNDCKIVEVLLKEFEEKDSLLIVNNILSWLDNVLNIVYTIVNIIVYYSIHKTFNKQIYHEKFHEFRSLATFFMRKVVNDFEIDNDDKIHKFNKDDCIMLNNGTKETVFGISKRRCPSSSWSYKIVYVISNLIIENYNITNKTKVLKKCQLNKSWFWNKYSTNGLDISYHKLFS